MTRGEVKTTSFPITFNTTYQINLTDGDNNYGQDNTRVNSFSTSNFTYYSGASYVGNWIGTGK